MQPKKVIVIGSGVAGMAVAIRLAVKGFDVKVFEKNAYPGGKLTMFEKDGFRFDAGPSLFTQPQNIEDLFENAGEPIADYFEYKPINIACNYFFESGKIIKGYTDSVAFSEELTQQTGEQTTAVSRYLRESEKIFDNIGSVFLNHSLHKRSTWFNKRIITAFKTVKLPYLFKSLNKYNESHFTSPEAVQIFNRYATYNGSNPYKAPSMLSLI
ncbi:MAG: FAD-dependent oxidoreductase, partial [Ferruginibacter sp.]